MNKRNIIASMAVLPLFVGTVNAQSVQGMVTADSLNVRTGPSTSYTTKFTINKGDTVTVEESANGWYKITTKDGKNGWASSKYIQTSQNTVTTIKIVSISSLNMRSGPSTSYSVIQTLSKNTQVEVISVENGWAKIKYNSKTGYVSNQYLSDKKEESTTQIKYVNATNLNVRSGPATTYSILGTLNQNTKVEVISVENDWAKIKYNSQIGYVSNKYLSDKKEESTTQIKYVNATNLNVRSGPATTYSILGILNQNAQVEVISVENDWAKIKYNSQIGYVSNKYLSDKKEESTTQTKYVNATSLNVRSGPATTYEILSTYKYGQEVKVVSISVDKEWAKIKYNDGYAYVSNKYLVDELPSDKEENKPSSGTITGTYEDVNCSFETMVNYEYKLSQQGYNKIRANLSTNYSNSSAYIKATREDLSKYLNPETFSTNATGKLQFLKIDKYREGITASELNTFFSKYCKSNSVFLNKGQAFIDAAKKYNLDVTYLVAASMVETGYGSSTLAQGVYVTTPSGDQVKVYNFFGISAFDGTAVLSAANYAYKKGWTSIDRTIEGSAQWIASNYIHNSKYKQNTLYKMRWSYNTGHQYATDVNWANSIGRVMNNIVPYYGGAVNLEYLIPRYK